MKPEQKARVRIDAQLEEAGWRVTSDKLAYAEEAAVAIREWVFPNGKAADYLLFYEGKAIAVVEAKEEALLLGGVFYQADEYASLISGETPTWQKKLPFIYLANGNVVSFADRRDDGNHSRLRNIFTFHRPNTLRDWLVSSYVQARKLRELRNIPIPLDLHLRDCQKDAVINLEVSLAAQRRRAYISMATGAGKTYTACSFCYRLLEYVKAQRILFLVDRGNLGSQAHDEFANWVVPGGDGRKFNQDYSVVKLASNMIPSHAKVVISTIQRIYSILTNSPLDDEEDERSSETKEIKKAIYNASLPIEYFDFIVVDECHRSIYNNWRSVLEYFDSTIIGLTATPSDVTDAFFEQNKVSEYSYDNSVHDGVNVGYCVYRIKTDKTENGGVIKAHGEFTPYRRDLVHHKLENVELNDDIGYQGNQLNRLVESESQVRTILETYKRAIYTDLFPFRKSDNEEYNINFIPKTLIFAQTDAHAELITRIAKEVFGRGDKFCQKVTYSVSGTDSQSLVRAFRTDPMFRIAVTVDMIATGTDVRSIEVVLFMRFVRSAIYYQQMYGRGCRTISDNMLRNVTPNATSKDFFYLVDAIGVTEHTPVTSPPQIERGSKKTLEELMEDAHADRLDPEEWKYLGYRLRRIINKCLRQGYNKELYEVSFIKKEEDDISYYDGSIAADDTVFYLMDLAQYLKSSSTASSFGYCFDPEHRTQILKLARLNSIWIDPSPDSLISAEFSQSKAKEVTDSFRSFIEGNIEKYIALRLIFSVGSQQRVLLREDLEELVEAMSHQNALFTRNTLWHYYSIRYPDKCSELDKKNSTLGDIIQLVKFAMREDRLDAFRGRAMSNFELWVGRRNKEGIIFSEVQRELLNRIRDAIIDQMAYHPLDFRTIDPSFLPRCVKFDVCQYIEDIYTTLIANEYAG